MGWQLPLFLNIVFTTIRGPVEKKLINRIDPFMVYFYVNFWGTLFFLLLYIFRHLSFPQIYPEMTFLGILLAFSYGSYLSAAKISLSQSVIFGSYYLFVSLLLAAIFLGELKMFDPSQSSGQKIILGTIFAFVAIFLLLVSDSKNKAKMEKRWLYFILTTIILSGVGTFWGKLFIVNHGPLETLFSQALGGLPVLFIINKVRGQNFKLHKSNILWTILVGFLMVTATVSYYTAIKSGPLMLILPIQTIAITILVALSGLIFFKEAQKITGKKIAGMILGILGVILLMI